MNFSTMPLWIAAASIAAAATSAADTTPVFDIPKVESLKIDGDPSDWGERGFRVDLMTGMNGAMRPAADFQPAYRLGWNEQGLCVLVTVTDDVPLEVAQKKEIWKGDSVEFFMATARGSTDSFQVVAGPGRDPKNPELRYTVNDYRNSGGAPIEIGLARTVTPTGYILEALLPWQNFKLEAKEGLEFAFQIYVNDTDKLGERFQALWYPQSESHEHTDRMYRVRLAKNPSPAIRTAIQITYEPNGQPVFSLLAPPMMLGQKVRVKDSCKTCGKGKFESENGWAAVKMKLSDPKENAYGPLSVLIGDEMETTVELPAK